MAMTEIIDRDTGKSYWERDNSTSADIKHVYVGGGDSGATRSLVKKYLNNAQSSLSSATGRNAQAAASAATISNYTPKIAGAADAVRGQAQATIPLAGKTEAAVDALSPYAAALKSYGDQLFNEGASMVESGRGLEGFGKALFGMDASGGGLIGQYIDNIMQYDPELKVSQAASDVQNAAENAQAQNDRNLARRGVNSSSGAALVARENAARTLAAILAGAKTNARQAAQNEQNTALRNALADAASLFDKGIEAQRAGAGVQGLGADTTGKAADVQKDIVNGLTQVAGIRESIANMFGKVGNILGEAGANEARAAAAMRDSAGVDAQIAGYYDKLHNTLKQNGGFVSGGSQVVNSASYDAERIMRDLMFKGKI